jgi:hypothetical protein
MLLDRYSIFTIIKFFYKIFINRIIVLDWHPNTFSNLIAWDSIYYEGNPKKISNVKKKEGNEIINSFINFERVLKLIHILQKLKILIVTNRLKKSDKILNITKKDVDNIYKTSIYWCTNFFRYYPKFLYNHHLFYFKEAVSNKVI